jgi:hypothetical protein
VRHAHLHGFRAPPTAAIFSFELDMVDAPVAVAAPLGAHLGRTGADPDSARR